MNDKAQKVQQLRRLVASNRTKKGLISIVIPIYGTFDSERALLTIESIKDQRNVDLEIVISEEGESPRLKDRVDSSIKYIFRYHKQSAILNDFRPGLVRNLAIGLSCGEFLYTNDADVLFINPYYLEALLKQLKQDPSLAFYRPPMRRLPQENFREFLRRTNSIGIRRTIDSLDFTQFYLATTDKKKRELKIVTRQRRVYEKTFTTSVENFQRYVNEPFLKGSEPIIWSEDRHAGGNFIRRKQFDLVGGYCEEFINWGCEDSDLQWKLSEFFNLQLLPKEPHVEVLHLDHSMTYFLREMWARNEEVCNRRKKDGVVRSVIGDLNTCMGLK